jgi:hypothetical protein
MKDLTNPKLIWMKGLLFFGLGALASAALLLEAGSVKVALLLLLAVWSFCRAYYFVFYVIEHYVDSSYRFAGLWAFLRYALRRRGDGR